MECLGLHNKPKPEVQPGHKLTGPKEEEEEEDISHADLRGSMTSHRPFSWTENP
jgi:hypothetical protein